MKFKLEDSKRPNCLRKFHEKRLGKIEHFDEILEVDDNVIFKN